MTLKGGGFRRARKSLAVCLTLALVILPVARAFSQGVGEFTAAPGTGRPICESITNPVTNQSWCRDGNPPYALKVWDGTQWVSITAGGGGTVIGSGADTEIAVWNASNSLTGFPTFTRTPFNFNVSYSAFQELAVGSGTIDMVGVISLGSFGGSPSSLAFFSPGGQTATFRASSSATGSWACSWPGATGAPGQVMKWHNAITPCALEWDDVIQGGTCPAGQVVSAISASGTVTCTANAAGVSGKVTICDAAKTSSVVFATAASSNAYPVTLGTQPSTGTPPHVLADYNTPTTAGFNISISEAPGTGNCVDVSWNVGGVSAASASGVNGTGTPPDLVIWTGTTQIGNFAGSSCSISGQFASSISAAGTFTCATPSTVNANYARRVCSIVIGADNGSALADADLGPQADQCEVPIAGTVIEVGVTADAGTPSILPNRRVVGGASTNLLSGALATAAAGAYACSNAAGTTSINGTTTCSATLTTTAMSAGNWYGLSSGVAGGTAKRMSISIIYTVP